MSPVRVRFAPSPTGYLHIGGARTALYNWLFARQNRGVFLLRIEDTDRERSTDASVQAIFEGMTWLGMDWDEGPGHEGACGPYFQTQRMEIYREHVETLLKKGLAYRCYMTAEELDALRKEAEAKGEPFRYDRRWRDKGEADWPTDRPYAVRFKAPLDRTIEVEDMVKGHVVFESDKHVDDFVIARSDGTPTYNFTVVVDDVTMGITHVIRGDDHLNNTPKQILLYEGFGYPTPKFAHLPMILGSDKTRLSKRHGATSVTAYRDMGYLPQALVNYLARLGWSHGDEEVFSRDQLVTFFSLDSVGKSAGVFNPEKLLWLNQHYIMNEPPEEIARGLLPYLAQVGVATEWSERLVQIVRQLNTRSKTMVEMAQSALIFFRAPEEYDPKAAAKFFTADAARLFNRLIPLLSALDPFDCPSIKGVFDLLMAETGQGLGKIAQPVRVAVTGTTVSPGIYETLEILGKEETLRRLNAAAAKMPGA